MIPAMKRPALFVGIDRYADAAFRDLRYSVADAAVLAGAFSRYGFDASVLTNPKADELLEAVERRTAGLGPGDVFLFFFAGHGFTAPDGSHLLICSGDRLSFLRHNRAGVPVDLLEDLTNEGGFHRAFLLDACRTDVFAGAEARGAATRDLALVALPDAAEHPGTCCVLRSCDRFCPALEFDDLGHGVFTSAVLDLMGDEASRGLLLGDPFVTALRARMHGILAAHGMPGDQNPNFQTNGDPFRLFDAASGIGSAPPPAPVLVVCPVCGKKNDPKDTFRCRECGCDDLCLDHRDRTSFLCPACAEKARREEAERNAAEERARREREEAERQERERKARAEAARKAREEAERKSREWIGAQAGERKVVRVGSVDVPLRWCPPGTFTMGSPADESGRYDDETQHRVTLTKGFWMGETPVTNGLWKSVMGIYPEYKEELLEAAKEAGVEFIGDNCPAGSVSWNDCQVFLRQLNAKVPSGWRFELPTEAQWEYACRAGTTGAYGGTGRLNDMGVCFEPERLCPFQLAVGQKTPNAWGLYDMHGNVGEWCADWYGSYSLGAVTDPTGPTSGSSRVVRGGSKALDARDCRSACRSCYHPERGCIIVGVRVAMVAAQ